MEPGFEKPEYPTQQLITYIGNKRALLDFIGMGIDIVCARLQKKKLRIFDAFSGSGCVARFFKKHAASLVVNDLEKYSEIINRCYLANESALDLVSLKEIHAAMTRRLRHDPLRSGFIAELYAPVNDEDVRSGERVFYTTRNARYLDTARQYIEELPCAIRHFYLAPLLAEASVHANTAGVFKGFYKNSSTRKGQFGGNNRDALTRIKSDIELPFPVFSNFECDVRIMRGDANQIIDYIDEVDVVYIDPPYNQHPYGSNYFMLNLLVDYIRPNKISQVSGIPVDWYRSDYNKRNNAVRALSSLLERVRAKFILLSFNSEGFISLPSMTALLEKIGKTTVLETKYNAFRGSRNLRNRDIHVKEYLYLVEK
jgi:adenine-specific DNA-methyltransferase